MARSESINGYSLPRIQATNALIVVSRLQNWTAWQADIYDTHDKRSWRGDPEYDLMIDRLRDAATVSQSRASKVLFEHHARGLQAYPEQGTFDIVAAALERFTVHDSVERWIKPESDN